MSTAVPTPPRKVFNWAEATDSDSENESPTYPKKNLQTATPVVVVAAAADNTKAANADDSPALTGADTAAEAAAVRELIAAASASTPSRHCQEVTIQSAIPYTLKSVWNPATAGASPSSAAATSHPSVGNSPSSAARVSQYGASPSSMHTFSNATTPSVLSAAAIASMGIPRPLRMNRAVDELTAVLRQYGDKMPYDELMSRSNWRSRFQPSFGSLFTFLKRNRDIFHYQQSVVELKQEGTIVSELLKINWLTSAAAAAAAAAANTSGNIATQNRPATNTMQQPDFSS